MAGRTRLLDREEALLHAHLAHAIAGRAGFLAGTRLGTIAIAVATGGQTRHADIDRGTGNRRFQIEIQVVTQVAAALRSVRIATTTAATEDVTEDIAEHIAEAAGTTTAKAAATEATAALTIDTGMTELVIGGALVSIGQHFVGFRDFTELLGRSFIIRVAVRVMLLGQASVRLLDVLGVGATLDTKHFVIITLGHGSGPPGLLAA